MLVCDLDAFAQSSSCLPIDGQGRGLLLFIGNRYTSQKLIRSRIANFEPTRSQFFINNLTFPKIFPSVFLSSILTLSHTDSYPPLPKFPAESWRHSFIPKVTRTWNRNRCSKPNVLVDIEHSSVAFRSELISKLAEESPQQNFVISPLYVQLVLFVVNSGIKRDDYFNSFENAFGIPQTYCFKTIGMQVIVDHLQNYAGTGLSVASSLFVSPRVQLRHKFIDSITTLLHSPIRYIDFENTLERETFIWKWGANQTKDVVDARTSLAVVNVIHFQGEWLQKFNGTATKVRTYSDNRGKSKQVSIMEITGHIRHGIHPNADAVFYELPFLASEGRQNMSMFCIRPRCVKKDESTVDFWDKIKNFTIEELILIGKYETISIELPKFTIASKIDAKSVVERAAGEATIFDPSTQSSSQITESPKLFVDKFRQSFDIIVNEDGIEATAIDTIADPPPPDSSNSFVFDSPVFIMICTMGRSPQIVFSALYIV